MEWARVAHVKASHAHLPKTCNSSQGVVRNMWRGYIHEDGCRERAHVRVIVVGHAARTRATSNDDEKMKQQQRKRRQQQRIISQREEKASVDLSLSRCSFGRLLSLSCACALSLGARYHAWIRCLLMSLRCQVVPPPPASLPAAATAASASMPCFNRQLQCCVGILASFGVEPCCTQRHCCYDDSVASIVLVLPNNERGRTEAVARMLRTMRQHDGQLRLVHPLDSSRRVCQPWFCFLLVASAGGSFPTPRT